MSAETNPRVDLGIGCCCRSQRIVSVLLAASDSLPVLHRVWSAWLFSYGRRLCCPCSLHQL